MKRIGLIDYYLDEWHANNYPGWIRDNAKASSRCCEVAYAWAEIDRPGGIDTLNWCKNHNVHALSSIEELVEKSDYIIVLSPDNPEHHERLGHLPFQSGKPVYMDKTFSPDLASGRRMFEQAETYRTPLFSSSALRFAKELSNYPNAEVNRETLEYLATMGPGTYKNYSVHQYEIIVSLLGPGARQIKSLSSEHGQLLVIEYDDGRQASFCQMENAPFQLNIQLNNGNGVGYLNVPICLLV